MQKILVINVDPDLQRALVRVANALKVGLQSTERWEDARQQLVLNHYDLVCLHYDDFRVEGLESFILLDNILQKELTPGLLLMRASSARARQLSESLESLQHTLELDRAGANLEVQLKEMIAGMLAIAETLQHQHESATADQHQHRATGSLEQRGCFVAQAVRLAQYEQGNLEQTTLTRLLYTLRVHRLTGTLTLRQQRVVRRYPFRKGYLIELKDPDYADSAALQSAFAWTHGDFSFEVGAEFAGGHAIDTMVLIVSGIRKNLNQRRAMDVLMPLMQMYPAIVARFWERQQSKLNWPELHAMMHLCTGQQTLEVVLSRMGADVTAGFLAAYMARGTDLLFFCKEPTSRPVVVSYNMEGIQADGDSAGSDRASALREEAERKKTKAYRASTGERAELEKELHRAFEAIQESSVYEVFGVWEGCGRTVVKERFYVLVKEHHPDVYGGNVSDEVKRLAQLIFMRVKDIYGELMKIETVQTVPDPSLQEKQISESQSSIQNKVEQVPVAQPRRRPIDTPLATQISMQSSAVSPGSAGFSRRNTTPIGLGREPSEAHPDVVRDSVRSKERQDKMEQLTQRAARARTISAAGLTLPTAPGRTHTPIMQGLPTGGIRTDSPKSDVEPTTAKGLFNEGFVLFRNKQYDEALVYLTRAYEMDPDDGLYLTFYGYCLFLTDSDQRKKSQEILTKALATKHRQAMPDAYLFLGRMLMVDNRLEHAREHFEYALQLNPSSVEIQRELRLVEHRIKGKNGKGSFLRNLFKR